MTATTKMQIDTDDQRRVLLAALVSYRRTLKRRRPKLGSPEHVMRKHKLATIDVLEQRLWGLDGHMDAAS